MLILLAILMILIIVVLSKVLRYDCHPSGTKHGHYSATRYYGRYDVLNRDDTLEAACVWNMSGFFGRPELKPVSLYYGSAAFG